jgi:hypothetical protein
MKHESQINIIYGLFRGVEGGFAIRWLKEFPKIK